MPSLGAFAEACAQAKASALAKWRKVTRSGLMYNRTLVHRDYGS
jgi:hypothetical protein